MAYSETIQQVFAEAEAISKLLSTDSEALIAEAKAIPANFGLNRDEGELNERLLALGIALSAGHGRAKSEEEKRALALGFITGVISDESNLEENLLALCRAILH